MSGIKYCLVYGCGNHSSEGNFTGDLCSACYNYLLTAGRPWLGRGFLGDLNRKAEAFDALTRALSEELRRLP